MTERGIGLKVLTGEGAAIDTTTAKGRLISGIFAGLAEFELIVELTRQVWSQHEHEADTAGVRSR